MNTENAYLITMPIYGVRKGDDGKNLIHHSSIINYGENIGNNLVKSVFKDGIRIQSIFEFPSSMRIFKFSEICLENLMSGWKKTNKEYKPIVLDESINTHEVFENDYSPLKIMVERRENEIAIKPIFETL